MCVCRGTANGEVFEDTQKRGKPIVFISGSRPLTGGLCLGAEEGLTGMRGGEEHLPLSLCCKHACTASFLSLPKYDSVSTIVGPLEECLSSLTSLPCRLFNNVIFEDVCEPLHNRIISLVHLLLPAMVRSSKAHISDRLCVAA